MTKKQINFTEFTRPEDLLAFLSQQTHQTDQKRCVLYVRKSRVIAGKEQYSDQVQKERCLEFAKQQGWEVVAIFVDMDRSGKNSNRGEFQQMLDLVETGVVDIILVHHLDRTYRNGYSFAGLMSFLQSYNVELVSLSEKLDSRTFHGRLMMMVLAATAEWPVWAASERSRESVDMRFRKGLHNGGYRLGYCNGRCSACTDPNGNGYCPQYGQPDRPESEGGTVQVHHPIEKHVVLLIAVRYHDGMSDKEIADYLNGHVFELPDGSRVKFRTKGVKNSYPPGEFTRDSVRDIVRNRFYAGDVVRYPTPSLSMADDIRHPERIHVTVKDRRKPLKHNKGRHEPLYPYELWKENQQLRAAKGKTPTQGGKPTHTYLLTGIARCAECYQEDGRMASLRGSTNGSGTQAYRCATLCDKHHSQGNGKSGNIVSSELTVLGMPELDTLVARHTCTNLPALDLDSLAAKQLQKLSIPSDWYDRILAYMFSEHGISDFERQGHNLRRELERFQNLYLGGHISQDEYEQQARKTASALSQLTPTARPEAREILPLLEDFPAIWVQMTPLEKRTVLRDIFAALYFDGQGKLVEARPHVPFASLL